mmetsp:Transcript_11313/g.35174  ORF Transcript_11313/g.35174 Transcript_11313/m.35174 type:complete len:214 (+) Transcript_11313:508-1149(+)
MPNSSAISPPIDAALVARIVALRAPPASAIGKAYMVLPGTAMPPRGTNVVTDFCEKDSSGAGSAGLRRFIESELAVDRSALRARRSTTRCIHATVEMPVSGCTGAARNAFRFRHARWITRMQYACVAVNARVPKTVTTASLTYLAMERRSTLNLRNASAWTMSGYSAWKWLSTGTFIVPMRRITSARVASNVKSVRIGGSSRSRSARSSALAD